MPIYNHLSKAELENRLEKATQAHAQAILRRPINLNPLFEKAWLAETLLDRTQDKRYESIYKAAVSQLIIFYKSSPGGITPVIIPPEDPPVAFKQEVISPRQLFHLGRWLHDYDSFFRIGDAKSRNKGFRYMLDAVDKSTAVLKDAEDKHLLRKTYLALASQALKPEPGPSEALAGLVTESDTFMRLSSAYVYLMHAVNDNPRKPFRSSNSLKETSFSYAFSPDDSCVIQRLDRMSACTMHTWRLTPNLCRDDNGFTPLDDGTIAGNPSEKRKTNEPAGQPLSCPRSKSMGSIS